ncbi:pyridoxal-phosphate dependent enzyme [Halostagnicola bangensis]
MPADLVCPACDTVYDASPDEPWRCSCGRALEFLEGEPLEETEDVPTELSLEEPRNDLWAFADLLPIEKHVSLHEGATPLVDAPRWDASFKLEYVFPTGSFKDRGATTTLSRAVELGVEKVIEDSSGNAGAAIATYAARAGLEADIYVPADVKRSKLRAIERVGARPVQVEGTRADVTTACLEAVEDGETGWYASHAWNPAFYAGTMTFAFELAAQRGWTVPDAVVLPIGHGTLFLGAYRGFSRLEETGITDDIPRLLGVQATSHAPVVRRLEGETSAGVPSGVDEPQATVADGIQIAEPAREDELVEAIEASGGDAIALENEPIETALNRLHRSGFYVEPTSAIAPAAVSRYRELGILGDDDDIVVPLTGSGLKIS